MSQEIDWQQADLRAEALQQELNRVVAALERINTGGRLTDAIPTENRQPIWMVVIKENDQQIKVLFGQDREALWQKAQREFPGATLRMRRGQPDEEV